MKSNQESLIRRGLPRVAVETAAVALTLSLLVSAGACLQTLRASSSYGLTSLASVVVASLCISTFVWWRLQARIVNPIKLLADQDKCGQFAAVDRRAAMADIATGVLHDVSNVMGNMHVSVSLAQARIRQSKVSELARTVDLLADHQNDLAWFLANDPKGRQLPGLLRLLAMHLSDERADILAELDVLNRTVGHVKTIVSTQQSYATTPAQM